MWPGALWPVAATQNGTGGASVDLTAPTPPAQGPAEAAGTTSVSVTYTHAGAPAGTTYALSVVNIATGSAITPTSGSGLGPYAIPVSDGLSALHYMTATGTDGQTARSISRSISVAASPALAWAAPSAAAVSAGTTTATITWATPTGGTAPYSYGAASVVYDSQGASTTVTLSTSGSGAGSTTLSGLANGQTVILSRTVTDAASASRTVQGVATVAASAATITPGTAPASQSLAAGTTSATIGTWGAPSGGTGPYTYAVTELGGSGVTIAGSGLGPWSVAGLSDGVTYAFMLTITDSLSAKGYSVVTITTGRVAVTGEWTVVDALDFTDANWTAFSTTSTTASTSAWYATLYASDGTTPRAYVYNNSVEARTLSLSPSGSGLTLVNGAITNQPSVGIWPAGWDTLRGGSRRDLWMVEAIVAGKEPSGTAAFVHIMDLSRDGYTTPGTGLRNINTASSSMVRAISYLVSAAEQAIQTVAPGTYREYTAGVQVTINDQRQHDVFVRVGATDYGDPQSGQRVRVQVASGAMTSTAGNYPVSANWFDANIQFRTKWWLYHDGSATTNSEVRLLKLRLLRKVNGST
jgi:cold shock CspA family protein